MYRTFLNKPDFQVILFSDFSKKKLQSSLNFEQLIAVTNLNGYFLVIAGAGSGKTRVIIYRTLLLLELKINPKNILILTFTRKAILEIKNRLYNFYPNTEVQIETFHSLAFKLLKKFSQNKNFKILMSDDYLKLAKKSIYYKEVSILFRENDIISILTNKNNFLLNKLNKTSKNLVCKFLEDFISLKTQNNLFTFDDLLIKLLLLLETNIIPLSYDYIMVDEYQDTDDIQINILKKISVKNNLMVVGDDFQSIYSFKGARFDNILNFHKEFKNTNTIVLNQNYRSSPSIVNFTNEFSKSLEQTFKKSLTSKNIDFGKPTLSIFKNYLDEIESIYNNILEIISLDSNATIGILFRNFIFMENFINFFKVKNLNFSVIPNPFLINIFKNLNFNESSNISLLTIHSSKGLEWDYIFIPLLLDGVLPTSIGDTLNLEEEKRLFYVASSRAKKMLYLSYPLNFYNDFGYFSKPSPFINNLSSSFIQIKRG